MLKIVIVGGGYAGVACALRLAWRLRESGTRAQIQLVEPGATLVERIRLHQRAAGQRVREWPLASLLAGSGVEWISGRAEWLDLDGRRVHVDGRELAWDRLVLAVGSHVDLDRVRGAGQHAMALESATAQAMRERLAGLAGGARVAIVGGGLTAIELASEIAQAHPGLEVHLVAAGEVAAGFSDRGRAHIGDVLARLKVLVHEHAPVHCVEAGRLQADTGPIDFALGIWAAGFAAPAWLGETGLRTRANGQVLLDPMLRALSHPDVYVAGDAGTPEIPRGQPLPMGCKSALPMGAHVADNIAAEVRGDAPLPFDYALLFYCVSLGRRDGLIQWADDAGRLTGRTLTGRRAAAFKEVICRSTMWALRLEAKGIAAVVWKHTHKARSKPLAAQA